MNFHNRNLMAIQCFLESRLSLLTYFYEIAAYLLGSSECSRSFGSRPELRKKHFLKYFNRVSFFDIDPYAPNFRSRNEVKLEDLARPPPVASPIVFELSGRRLTFFVVTTDHLRSCPFCCGSITINPTPAIAEAATFAKFGLIPQGGRAEERRVWAGRRRACGRSCSRADTSERTDGRSGSPVVREGRVGPVCVRYRCPRRQ
ncbi:hypothetical protein GE061_012928 [Apolygus lucorum]|uniref:Uncharacterized protein n=1 Tax=Apolygus lucorum TaxID=248454 RepID=A0A8S9XWD0_APOLU|nr:hypothetical protein GE061_012928 [Apolygus lucorum]